MTGDEMMTKVCDHLVVVVVAGKLFTETPHFKKISRY